ncbi:uncharacterized protein LOC128890380 [Hylaeus anthracinus]|uniref:uncharacterized protein LOC128890380 n=1 Tax=Hylaeus anthracinus TaxID=313031 RepID=UPI0023B98ECD|nr:uncharacterized protein LOC128890380 [Hylaeus anthracinus]
MDLDGNDYAVQRDRKGEPRLEATSVVRKIRYKENEEDTASRKSNCSLESAGSRDFAENRMDREYQTSGQQSGNYAEMCEHERGGGNVSDVNLVKFDDENAWQRKDCDPWYVGHGSEKDAPAFDADEGSAYGGCRNGINISVVSQREICEKKIEVEPKYNVSFKSCYDRLKQEDPCGSSTNFRCTFENCCGNCESFIMEIPQSDYDDACQNWQNMNFEPENACFDDCCCSQKMKVYSSNVSISPTTRTENPCATCVEKEKRCPLEDPKYLSNCRTSSKQCLQRVHFTKPRHSACSFCSRKCTPSKASLFVEIGESVADVCGLRLGQIFQVCQESTESLEDCPKRRERSAARRNKSDSLRSRSKSKKHGDTVKKCSLNCKTRPGAMGRSFSDRIDSMEKCFDQDAIDQRTLAAMGLCNPRTKHARSTVSFQDQRECRAQTDSCVFVGKKSSCCDEQCETCDRSLWEDIRRGKLWLQLQDTCKNFVKVATTNIGQIMKQTSKIKRSKKSAKDPRAFQTCATKCDRSDPCADQTNPPECLHETICCEEILSDKPKNYDVRCCQNICCSANDISNVAELPDCQKYDRCNYRNTREQTVLNKGWHSGPRDEDVQRNVYPPNGEPITDSQRPEYGETRKRGGSDGNAGQRRKSSNSNRISNSTARRQSDASHNRGSSSSRNQERPRQVVQEDNSSIDQQDASMIVHPDQSGRTVTFMDVQVQADTIIMETEPTNSPYSTRSVQFQKRIRAMRQVNTISADSPEIAGQRRPAIGASKTSKKQPALPQRKSSVQHGFATSTPIRRENVPKDKTAVSLLPLTDTGVQCELIKSHRVICSDREAEETFGEDAESCICPPQKATIPSTAAETPQVAQEVTNGAAAPADAGTTEGPIITPTLSGDADVNEDEAVADTSVEQTVEDVEDASAAKEQDKVEETLVEDVAEIGGPSAVEEPTGISEDVPADKPAESGQEAPVPEKNVELDHTGDDALTKTDTAEAAPEVAYLELEKTETDAVDAVPEVIDATVEESQTVSEEERARADPLAPSAIEPTPEKAQTVDVTPREVDPIVDKSVEKSDTSEGITTLTPAADMAAAGLQSVDLSMEPFEYSQEFEGRRNYVSVEMQTSSTILTKILSEYQVGNKKRRILMSIKLQTTLDGDNGHEHPAKSNGAEVRRTAYILLPS